MSDALRRQNDSSTIAKVAWMLTSGIVAVAFLGVGWKVSRWVFDAAGQTPDAQLYATAVLGLFTLNSALILATGYSRAIHGDLYA